MTDNQNITIETYENGITQYFESTDKEVTGEFKDYIDSFLALVPQDAAILEIGSATGRDADYIESQGYTVTRTDVVEGFLDYQREQGHTVEKYDAIAGDLSKTFDLIIATAVFLHFDDEQFSQALHNTKRHLNPGGYFAISLKQGEGEEYSEHKMDSPRYFKYWDKKTLQTALTDVGFSIHAVSESPDRKWIRCIAQT